MALWQANSNTRLLSETIDRHAKAFKWSTGISHGRGTRDSEEVLCHYCASCNFKSQRKRNRNPPDLFVCLSLLSPLRSKNYFRLKVPVSRSKRERACCFTRSFKEIMIGCNSKTIRPICFKFCRIVALRGILQYTKGCHHNIICPDTALRIVLSEWLTRQMTGV